MPETIALNEWVERYRVAWQTADADAVVSLFTTDASYRDNIFEDPHVGTDGIRTYWNTVTSVQSDVSVRMGSPLVDATRVIVEFWTNMKVAGDAVTLPGVLILDMDANGLCRALREYWHFQPGTFEPPPGWGT